VTKITEAGRRVRGLKLSQVKQIITQLKTLIANLEDFTGWADYADNVFGWQGRKS